MAGDGGRGGDGVVDQDGELVGDGPGIGFEDGGVDFGENGMDGLRLRGEFDGEVGLELID
jgi:hypothetical protein